MLSDSTGYGSSTGSASIYSSCIAVPASNNGNPSIFSFQRGQQTFLIKPRSKDSERNAEVEMDSSLACYYLDEGYLTKSKQRNRISTDSNFSDFNSDSDFLEDGGSPVLFRQPLDDQISMGTNQSRFYGADVFDNEYDQCPLESYLPSQFSSRRNTVPFGSPVTFMDENDDFLQIPESDASLKSVAPILPSKINAAKHFLERPSCTPFIRAPSSYDPDIEEHRRSLLQDSCEYHRGNSIRLRTMPLPLRANIVTAKVFEETSASVLVNLKECFVQNIQISTPAGTINRNSEPMKENLICLIPKEENSNTSTETEEAEEDFYTIDVLDEHTNGIQESLEPPPKPPRGRYRAKLVNSSTSFKKDTKPSKKCVQVKQGPVKRLSINTTSSETFFFNKNDKININGHLKSAANTHIPKKSILKNNGKPKTHFADPNEALFGPVEHIYETIDSDPSTVVSDDDRSSVPESHPRPVSFASSSTTTAVLEQKPKRRMPDLRPALPARPFCWPFSLFPPDLIFCPRSFHAYHRRCSLETGQIPFCQTTATHLNPAMELKSEPIKFGTTTKRIARMPSILSKIM